MAVTRKIIRIDEDLCNGCGNCIISCAEGALEIQDGKARLVAEKYCDGLGACLGDCPTGALKVIERTADEFDEEAVVERLEELKDAQEKPAPAMPCGCPSATIRTFDRSAACAQANEPARYESGPSALSHWPVQIRLVPPNAPFLKNAHLLIAADCVPAAYANLHRDFLQDRVILLGCPKFDDTQLYLDKFVQIFQTAGIKSITALFMEVPCCFGLPMLIKKALEVSGKNIPVEQVVIGVQGDVLRREKLVA
ncbi:MAG: 4Fe-4S dicluster domain-containing protein [Pseudomonadota bacterium]